MKSPEYKLYFKSTRNPQGVHHIKPKLRTCPFCSKRLNASDYDSHISIHNHEIKKPQFQVGEASLESLWKGRFKDVNLLELPLKTLRNKVRAANSLFPKEGNLRHWIAKHTTAKNGRVLRQKIRSLLDSNWGV